MKVREGEMFYRDAFGVRRDEGLYIEEPAKPRAYAVLGAGSALPTGFSREMLVSIYDEAEVTAAEEGEACLDKRPTP